MPGDVERWWSDQRSRQCGSKVRHADRAAAERAARMLELQTHGAFDVYRCAFCKRWHVGSAR